MARCLIVGCGCRGRLLARELVARGHAVRGTTRASSRRAEIERAGAESLLADPDRVATLAPALEQVGVLCLLLGSAVGGRERLAALHGTRLEMVLARIVDSTVRGVVYEAAGTVDRSLLRTGAERVRSACERSAIPYRLLSADRCQHREWLVEAAGAVERVLQGH